MTNTNTDNLEVLLSGLYEKITSMTSKHTIVDYMALEIDLRGIRTTYNPEKIKDAVYRTFSLNDGAVERDSILDKCIDSTIGINLGPCPEAKFDLRNDYLITLLMLAANGKIVMDYKNGKIELTSDNSQKIGATLEGLRNYKIIKSIANKLVNTMTNPQHLMFGSVRNRNYSINVEDLAVYTVDVIKENYESTKDISINKIDLIKKVTNLALMKSDYAKKEEILSSVISFINDLAETEVVELKDGKIIPIDGFREAFDEICTK